LVENCGINYVNKLDFKFFSFSRGGNSGLIAPILLFFLKGFESSLIQKHCASLSKIGRKL